MIATCFALIGFAAAVVVGAVAGNVVTSIILRAMVTMIVCSIVGRIVGAAAQYIIDDHIETYKTKNPIPEELSNVTDESENQVVFDPPLNDEQNPPAATTDQVATAGSS